MPNPLALLGDSIKAAAPILARLPFGFGSGVSVSANYATPVFFADGLVNRGSVGGGGATNWDALLGDPLSNSVVAAAADTIVRALPEAPLILERYKKATQGTGGEWTRVDQHEALDIFGANEHLSETELWGKTAEWKVIKGWAPWVVFYNKAGTRPVELWPWQPERVRYFGDEESPLARYEVQSDDGKWRPMASEQIIHFRHSLGWNLVDGYTPLTAGKQQLIGSNAAHVYQSALVLNSAVSSWLITVKAGDAQGAASEVTPEQFQAFVEALRRKYTANKSGVGGIDGINMPLEITRMAFSPSEMSIDKLIDGYNGTLCSLIGVSRKLLDLGDDPTYLNLGEAINDFWERRIVPDRNKDAATLNRQLLPLFGLDRAQWRYAFDYSGVAALQENADQLHTRWRANFAAGGCDLYTFQAKIGLPNVPDIYKGRFAKPTNPVPEEPEQDPVAPDSPIETKAAFGRQSEKPMFLHIDNGRVILATGADTGEAIKRFDPDQSRDEDGKWASGSGAASKGSRAARDLKPGTREQMKERFGVIIPGNATDVMVAGGKEEEVWGSYVEGAGRKQKRWIKHPDYEARQDVHKFARIAALHHDLPGLSEKLDSEIKAGGQNAHQALTLRLISKTGLRNGGKEGAGKAEAFGASSLLTSHAKVDGDKVTLDFIGKEGVRQRHAFTDPVLARHIEARQKAGQETIFDGDSGKTLSYLKKLTGDKYKVHDLRTYYGTALAAQRVKHITEREGVPKTEAEAKAQKTRIAKTVAAHLGNDWKQSLSTYIAPAVFDEWKSANTG